LDIGFILKKSAELSYVDIKAKFSPVKRDKRDLIAVYNFLN